MKNFHFPTKVSISFFMLFCLLLTSCLGGGNNGGLGGGLASSTGNIVTAVADSTPQNLIVGTAITSFNPLAAHGGTTPYTYSHTGTLPAGLSFNTSTGAVTGTPTATYAAANVVFSVQDGHGVVANTTSTVSFTVGAASASISATATTTAQSLTVGTAMASFSPLTPSGGATPYTYSIISGTLPPGLSLSTSTGAITGTPASSYTTANIVFSVKDANNVVASTVSTVSFVVSAGASQHFLYAENTSNNISAFAIDPSTEQLTNLTGSPYLVSTNHPLTIVTHPNGNFAYSGGLSGIQTYSINATTGALSPIGNENTNGASMGMMIDPSGHFLYSVDSSYPVTASGTATPSGAGHVFAYSINTLTGALTFISSYTVSNNPYMLTIDPTGRFLYVPNSLGCYCIYSFSINSTTGALTQTGTVPSGTFTQYAIVDPTGKYLYASNNGGSITEFTINQTTGLLTQFGTITETNGVFPMVFDHTGKFLYVGNDSNKNINSYSFDSNTGALALVGNPAATAGSGAASYVSGSHTIAIDPTGKYLFATNSVNSTIYAYTINTTTSGLTLVNGYPVSSGGIPYGLAFK
jgi:6-phosphogluconolactonase (cycloisomerase 2 family)